MRIFHRSTKHENMVRMEVSLAKGTLSTGSFPCLKGRLPANKDGCPTNAHGKKQHHGR